MDYNATAEELRNPEYAAHRNDPAACISNMQGKSTEVYRSFPLARWSEDIRQLGYEKKLDEKKNDGVDAGLGDGTTVGALCTQTLDLIKGNTLSQDLNYKDEAKRTRMDAMVQALVTAGVFDLALMTRLRAHGATASNRWLDLGSPNEGDIARAWQLIPE